MLLMRTPLSLWPAMRRLLGFHPYACPQSRVAKRGAHNLYVQLCYSNLYSYSLTLGVTLTPVTPAQPVPLVAENSYPLRG